MVLLNRSLYTPVFVPCFVFLAILNSVNTIISLVAHGLIQFHGSPTYVMPRIIIIDFLPIGVIVFNGENLIR